MFEFSSANVFILENLLLFLVYWSKVRSLSLCLLTIYKIRLAFLNDCPVYDKISSKNFAFTSHFFEGSIRRKILYGIIDWPCNSKVKTFLVGGYFFASLGCKSLLFLRFRFDFLPRQNLFTYFGLQEHTVFLLKALLALYLDLKDQGHSSILRACFSVSKHTYFTL